MKSKSSSIRRRTAAVTNIEPLENRAYLTGVVLGSPQPTAGASAGVAPVFVNLDDMNGDGKADLITANDATASVGNSVSVLPGNGNGTFGAAQTIPLDFAPYTIAEADFNGDGKLDIVAGSATSNKVAIILQNANGTFASAVDYTTGLTNSRSITVGDFNHDGRPDVAAVSDDAGRSNNVDILLNNGDGTLTASAPISVSKTHLASVVAFTAGGQTDLALADQDGNAVTILRGNGDGTFAIGSDYGVGSAPVSIATADFNNDGSADLVTANSTGGTVTTLLGNGDGTFQSGISSPVLGVPAGGGPLKVRTANFNNDGKPDAVVLLGPGSSADADVLLGNGDGSFHSGTLIATGGNTRTAIAAGDLNGDGLTDVEIADPTSVATLPNVTNQDHTAPTAAVDITQPTQVAGAPVIQFTVTYSDNTQIDASTLNNGNVTVTNPAGAVEAATLVSTNLGNGASVTATYQIAAPSGALASADNGAYTVTATSNSALAVKDANGNALAGGNIGSFNVFIAPPLAHGPDLVASPIVGKVPVSVIGGKRSQGVYRIAITNAGDRAATGFVVINLYVSPDAKIRGNAPLVATTTKKINLKPGKHVTVAFPRFVWPANVNGTYFLVANVNATNSIAETNYSDNVGVSSSAARIAPPFVDVVNLWNRAFPSTLVAGKRVVLTDLLQNNGNVPAKGGTIQVLASADGNVADGITLATVPASGSIAAGKSRNVPVRFKMPTLASGTYHLILVATYPGDTSLVNNTAASAGTFRV